VSDVYELADLLRANGSAVVSKGLEGQPAVIKGADRLLSEIFVCSGGHARTVIGPPCRTAHRWNSSFLWVLSCRGCNG
jgi:hypothetical protein